MDCILGLRQGAKGDEGWLLSFCYSWELRSVADRVTDTIRLGQPAARRPKNVRGAIGRRCFAVRNEEGSSPQRAMSWPGGGGQPRTDGVIGMHPSWLHRACLFS